MRRFAVVLSLLVAAFADASQSDAVSEIINASKGARVIFMGEPDHGDGGAMAARSRLTLALHRDHGVRWVVFESSAFDAQRVDAAIRRGEPPIAAVPDGLLDIWSASTELDPLFAAFGDSVGSDAPLRIGGMDVTSVGPTDRCLHCEDIRGRLGSIEREALRTRTAELLDDLERWWIAFDRTKAVQRPTDLVGRLDEAAVDLRGAGNAGIARELRGWAVWLRSITPRFPLTEDHVNERDAMMAENLLAFLDSIPDDERVVVFLHNLHAMRRQLPLKDAEGEPVQGMPVPVAEIVSRELGERVFCLALAAATGEVRASWNPAPREISLPPDSFEWEVLAGSDAESVFARCGHEGDAPRGPRPGGLVSFQPLSGDWDAMFDGVWVFRETRSVTRRDR